MPVESKASSTARSSTDEADETLAASCALLGVVARSLVDALQEVTLPQFRVLVILSSAGPLRMGAITTRMGAHPSTFSRTVDRLVAGGWVEREASPESRRETILTLSPRAPISSAESCPADERRS